MTAILLNSLTKAQMLHNLPANLLLSTVVKISNLMVTTRKNFNLLAKHDEWCPFHDNDLHKHRM